MSRLVEATTPLAPDELLFLEVHGSEALSTLFDLRISLLSKQASIAAKALLGKGITLAIETENGGPRRHLNGICTRFAMNGRSGDYHLYEARVRPWLWLASRRSDSRIFQQQKVPDIVESVLGRYGFPVKRKLSGSYRTWDYCVQYHETDLNFVSRIMEHEGIYYFFEHSAGKHTLVLADGIASHVALPGRSTVNYIGLDAATVADEEHFYAWRPREELDSGEYLATDYDFKRPKADLSTRNKHPAGHTFDAWERYQWPGGYTELGDGENYARTRMEALQAEQARASGDGTLRTLAPGYLMTLASCPRAEQNREHLIVGVTYHLKDNPYGSTAATTTGAEWNFSVLSQPTSVAYRPQRLTEKPRSNGPQVAVVVGPPGEEIYTDEYGRVKVQFPWDRYGTNDQNSSCWMRVSHPWAGSNYGAIHIPRVGQEVIVDHIDGDPDYPIITGRVYNADQMPPWALPENKTQSGILTRSSKDGAPGAGLKNGTGDANALRFEDKKGEEQLWLHAQKDQLTEVENDETKWVGRDRRKTIDRDELNHIQRDRTETVDRNETVTVHGQRDEEVDRNETITVHQNRTRTVDLNETVSIGRTRNKSVANNEIDKIGKTWSINVGKFKTETIGMAYMQNVGLGRMENVGAGYNLNVGAVMATVVGLSQFEKVGQNKSVSVGKTFKLEAGDAIELVVGSSVLVMKKDGSVTVNGRDIDIVASKHIQLDSKRIDLN